MNSTVTRRSNTSPGRSRRSRHRFRRLMMLVVFVLVVVVVVAIAVPTLNPFRGPSAAEIAREDVVAARAISPLRGRIVQIAESQVGYTTDPSSTYCNKY